MTEVSAESLYIPTPQDEIVPIMAGAIAVVGETTYSGAADVSIDFVTDNGYLDRPDNRVIMHSLGREPVITHSARLESSLTENGYAIRCDGRQDTFAQKPYDATIRTLHTADGQMAMTTHKERLADKTDSRIISEETVGYDAVKNIFLTAAEDAEPLTDPRPEWTLLGRSWGTNIMGFHVKRLIPIVSVLIQEIGQATAQPVPEDQHVRAEIRIDFSSGAGGRLYSGPHDRRQVIAFDRINRTARKGAQFMLEYQRHGFTGSEEFGFINACTLRTDDLSGEGVAQKKETLFQQDDQMWIVRKERTLPDPTVTISKEPAAGDAILQFARTVIGPIPSVIS